MKLILAMMLKNEGKTVRKSIESVLPFIDGAVVFIDETTDDNTREEVAQVIPGGKRTVVKEFKFDNNFAEVRNRVNDLARTELGADFVLILDGHEYLTGGAKIYFEELLKRDLSNVDIIDFTIIENSSPTGSYMFQQPRVIRPQVKYDSAIHNVILQTERKMCVPQICILHDQPAERYQARKEQRREINISGLLKKANEGDARSMFYVAQTHMEMGEHAEAYTWYEDYLDASEFGSEAYKACIQMYHCARALEYESPEQHLYNCFTYDVPANEHMLLLGSFYQEQGQLERAAHYCRMAAACKMPMRFLSVDAATYTWMPWLKLAEIHAMNNNVKGLLEAIAQGKRIAPEREEFYRMEESLKRTLANQGVTKKPVAYVVCSITSFIKPIMETFEQMGYVVTLEQKFDPETADLADVIWCEWADHNAIAVSHYDCSAKKILRVHSYEVYNPDFRNRIRWDAFDSTIFVASHVLKYLAGKLSYSSSIYIDMNWEVISNWVDEVRFAVAPGKEANNKIAYVGYVSAKKGAALLALVAQELVDYEIHVAGEFQGDDIEEFFRYRNFPNVFFHGRVEDVNQFLADKSYILNTSPREACPVSIIEGMLAGCHPLVYDWSGSNSFPREMRWQRLGELVRCVMTHGSFEPERLRQEGLQYSKSNLQPLLVAHINRIVEGENDGEEEIEVSRRPTEESLEPVQ